ncbi:MAG: hypothetical protein ACI35R_13245 [Bacillus sp. (in: firmicutes)]
MAENTISVDFGVTQMAVSKHEVENVSYFGLNFWNYDPKLLYPAEGVEPKKKIVTESFGFYSSDELREIIRSLEQIIEEKV